MLDHLPDKILVKNLHAYILHKLEDSLKCAEPCNWKALHTIIKQSDFFSNEENEQLDSLPSSDSSCFLSMLMQKDITCQMLADFLLQLPCDCSLNILKKGIGLTMDSIGLSRHPTFSLPMYHSERMQSMNFMSLPLSLQCNQDSAIQITEHPKSSSIDVGDDILLRCRVQADPQEEVSFQWYHMFTPIDGGKTHQLMIPEVQLQHQGYYCCTVSIGSSKPAKRSDWAFISIGPRSESNFHATDKFALLIANEVYTNHKRLPAATRDVEELSRILRDELNFKTLSFVNLNFTEMHRALKMLQDLASKGSYCVFYFGGHGYETDARCFMVPTDAPKEFKNSDCVNAHFELENIQRRCDPQLLFILLDICRKRNAIVDHNNPPPSSFLPNVVLAYATTEMREAYETAGHKHGIFVESLRKFVTSPVRVNHMLSKVQDDVKRSCLQISEVRSTLTEDRCLTDRIQPGEEGVKIHTRWLLNHDKIDSMYSRPIYLELGRKASAVAELRYRSVLTNKAEISVHLYRSGNCIECKVGFSPDHTFQFNSELLISDEQGKDIPRGVACYPSPIYINNLQKAKEGILIMVVFQYVLNPPRKYYTIRSEVMLNPHFLDYWWKETQL